MVNEFNALEEYANCIYECLKNITHDYLMAKDSEIRVMYATPSIAYAKWEEYFGNGSNIGPLITFYQSGIEVKDNETMGAWKYLPVVRDEGNYRLRAPVICNIKYTVTISALTETQADLITTQIMTMCPENRPYYTKLNGQFVLIKSSDPTNVGTVDAGENKDKVSQREITLEIERAYLNYDIKELNSGLIKFDPEDKPTETENYYIVKRLKNGAVVMNDGSIRLGKIIRNTSSGSDGFFNYNVIDDNNNVIETTTAGKVKLVMYALEGVKKK